MCAILTWAGRARRGQWPEVHDLLTEMMIASACRGTDASGFAAIDKRGKLIADKAPMRSSRFVAVSMAWSRLSSPSCLIGHCRAATHGSPQTGDNRNNHPFVGGRLAVVVNGVSPNYRNVAVDQGLKLTSECDSEVVLRLVEASETPSNGLQDCLDLLDGGIAAAVLDAKKKRILLARNERRPVWLLRLVHIDGIIACSTREIAETALRRMYGKGYASLVALLMPLASNSIIGISSEGYATVCGTPSILPLRRGLWLA